MIRTSLHIPCLQCVRIMAGLQVRNSHEVSLERCVTAAKSCFPVQNRVEAKSKKRRHSVINAKCMELFSMHMF